MQIAFYLETGGEIKWGAAKNFAHDCVGMKVLLSGSMQSCVVSTSVVIFARTMSNPLYNGAERLLHGFTKTFGILHSLVVSSGSIEKESVDGERLYCDSPTSSEWDEYSIASREDFKVASTTLKRDQARWYYISIAKVAYLAPSVAILILLAVRPTTFPYAHMSGSLPYTLADAWESKVDFCQSDLSGEFASFPFLNLVSEDVWERPHGQFLDGCQLPIFQHLIR